MPVSRGCEYGRWAPCRRGGEADLRPLKMWKDGTPDPVAAGDWVPKGSEGRSPSQRECRPRSSHPTAAKHNMYYTKLGWWV